LNGEGKVEMRDKKKGNGEEEENKGKTAVKIILLVKNVGQP